MALRHAVLAALLEGEASGYQLAKRFDVSVANFWSATPQQLYRELERMESLSATERPAACVAYGGAKPAECICPDDGVDEDCKATERRALLARVDGGGR